MPFTICNLFLVFSSLTILHSCQAANILAILPAVFPSHRMWCRPLLHSLAARGHHVTVLSSYPEQHPLPPNYTDLHIDNVPRIEDSPINFLDLSRDSTVSTLYAYYAFMDFVESHDLKGIVSNGTRTLLKSTEHFDLVIVDLCHAEFYLGFIHKFKYPRVIAVTSYGISPLGSYLLGSPMTSSYIPHGLVPVSDRMDFLERSLNLIMNVWMWWWFWNYQFPLMDKLAKEHFGETLPPLWEIGRSIDMMLVNFDFSLEFPRPLVPNILSVGGMHIAPVKPLPQDIQSFLDDAVDGVVVFSLGSALRSDRLSASTLAAFTLAFDDLLPHGLRVLWKWNGNIPPPGFAANNSAGNVRLVRWMSQNDVLAHRHVVAFITHGGLLSVQEAVHHAVPIIVLPVYGDQPCNARRVVERGIGKKLHLTTLNREELTQAIMSVVFEASYRENARRASSVFRDQPLSALQRAVYWTEYVLRHDGARHLRSAAADLPWYKYWSLDIMATLLVAVAAALYALAVALRSLLRWIREMSTTKLKVH